MQKSRSCSFYTPLALRNYPGHEIYFKSTLGVTERENEIRKNEEDL